MPTKSLVWKLFSLPENRYKKSHQLILTQQDESLKGKCVIFMPNHPESRTTPMKKTPFLIIKFESLTEKGSKTSNQSFSCESYIV